MADEQKLDPVTSTAPGEKLDPIAPAPNDAKEEFVQEAAPAQDEVIVSLPVIGRYCTNRF